jgi:hypothetical protein
MDSKRGTTTNPSSTSTTPTSRKLKCYLTPYSDAPPPYEAIGDHGMLGPWSAHDSRLSLTQYRCQTDGSSQIIITARGSAQDLSSSMCIKIIESHKECRAMLFELCAPVEADLETGTVHHSLFRDLGWHNMVVRTKSVVAPRTHNEATARICFVWLVFKSSGGFSRRLFDLD